MSPTATRQNALLDELAAGHAAEAAAYALRMRQIAELVDLAGFEQDASGVEQFIDMELAGTIRKGRLAAGNDVRDAHRLQEALPLTLERLARGQLYVHQARALMDATECCTVEVAQRVEARVLCEVTDLAPADLRRKVRRLVLQVESELDSAAVEQRLQEARASRNVRTRADQDGMSAIKVRAGSEHVRRWELDLERLVLQEKAADRAAGVWRSADQIRADLVLAMPGLLLEARQGGRSVPAKDALVNVLVPMATVLGLSSEPGEIVGVGPISAEHVRLLLPDARLRRVLVDADTGQPLWVDPEVQPAAGDRTHERVLAMLQPEVVTHRAEPQHDPSEELRRFVEVRDVRCRGVGCSLPANRCHKDHRDPYPTGPTAAWNLQALSASCHRAKHSGWRVTIRADGGTTWVSPLGRRYRRPPPYEKPLLV